VITVEPNEKLPGSTSVACWLVPLVKVSVLSFTSGVVGAGKLELLELELEEELSPQLRLTRIARVQEQMQTATFNLNAAPLCGSSHNCSIKVAALLALVNAHF